MNRLSNNDRAQSANAIGGGKPHSFRKPYSSPKLTVFGPVGALTQAGTGFKSEVMGNGMRSMSPNQQRA